MDLIDLFQVIYLQLILLLSSLQRLEEEISRTKTKGKRWFCLCVCFFLKLKFSYSVLTYVLFIVNRVFVIIPFERILEYFHLTLYFYISEVAFTFFFLGSVYQFPLLCRS